jgi:transposase InsO family protein
VEVYPEKIMESKPRANNRIEWLTDNGSAYTAHETRNFAASMGLAVCTTQVQSPGSNGMAPFKLGIILFNPVP